MLDPVSQTRRPNNLAAASNQTHCGPVMMGDNNGWAHKVYQPFESRNLRGRERSADCWIKQDDVDLPHSFTLASVHTIESKYAISGSYSSSNPPIGKTSRNNNCEAPCTPQSSRSLWHCPRPCVNTPFSTLSPATSARYTPRDSRQANHHSNSTGLGAEVTGRAGLENRGYSLCGYLRCHGPCTASI